MRKIQELNLEGVILAAAGLRRLGFADRITQYIPAERQPAGDRAGRARARGPRRRRADARAHRDLPPRADRDRGDGRARVPRAPRGRLPGADRGAGAGRGRTASSMEGLVGSVDGKVLIRDRGEGPGRRGGARRAASWPRRSSTPAAARSWPKSTRPAARSERGGGDGALRRCAARSTGWSAGAAARTRPAASDSAPHPCGTAAGRTPGCPRFASCSSIVTASAVTLPVSREGCERTHREDRPRHPGAGAGGGVLEAAARARRRRSSRSRPSRSSRRCRGRRPTAPSTGSPATTG